MTGTPLSISFPPTLESALREAVAAGEYASVEDAVAEAVALWNADRRAYHAELEDFRAKLAEAENDPGPDMTIDEVRAYFAVRDNSHEAA